MARYGLLRLALAGALLGLAAGVLLSAQAETVLWTGFFDPCYHAEAHCGGAVDLMRVSPDAAAAHGRAACPVCVSGEGDDARLAAVARGGTAVLRVPDAWMAAQADVSAAFSPLWTAAYTGPEAERQLAQLLHGGDYRGFQRAREGSRAAEAPVRLPEVRPGKGGRVMNRRHIGGAWYICVRPGEADRAAMAESRALEADLGFTAGRLAMEGEALSIAMYGEWRDPARRVKLSRLDGRAAFQGDYGSLRLALFREIGIDVCVLYLSGADRALLQDARLLLDGLDTGAELDGYMTGETGVFVCTLTAAETQALKAGATPSLRAAA